MAINREKLILKFEEEYRKLNKNQQQAVDHIEGPVMVIAGPGTGKTQILAARIGKILLETDVSPENILCLTYTDAGAMAMRRRLQFFIGPDAYKVNIYTFHAFCNDIIQDNLSLFEKNELDPISELEKIELLKQLIDSFPKGHPLKRYRGDVYYEMKNLSGLFSTMKREGWTGEFIEERINAYIADLPNRDGYTAKRATGNFKRGDLRTDKIDQEKEKMERLLAAVNEFSKFQEMVRVANRYDFDDMINWVIRAFNENKALLLQYQEKYQYILVDEFQDTSGTQNMLVTLLISYWDQPNIFVVGDDDQSIYRFQGANIENMEQFASNYARDLMTVVLTNNYRSTQSILDISKSLIDRNFDRLVNKRPGLTKELLSSHPDISGLTHLPTILEFESQRQEMAGITLRVEQLLAEAVAPGRIAVIYRENKYGDELMKFFRYRSIPVYSKRSVNLLETTLVKKMLQIIRYLSAEHDIPYGGDEMLFEILHFDCFDVPPMEIAKIAVEVADKQFTDSRTSIRRILYEKSKNPPRDLFDTGLHPTLKHAAQQLEQLISDVTNLTLQGLVESIVRKSGILNSIMRSPDKIWLLQVLIALFDFVKEETRRDPLMQAGKFIAITDLMYANNVFLPLPQVIGTEKGVNLLTAHGAKGLEFEYVFFCGCNANFWEKKKNPNRGYKFPDTVFSSQQAGSDEEELRRLFYVALTRAQKHLYITYSGCQNDGRGLEPSRFIAEILDSHELPVEKTFINSNDLMEFEALQFAETAAPEIAKLEEDFIARILEKFVMNVTALNNYLRCPLEFYFKNLIKIPSPKNEATEFGSSIHFALQRLFEKMKTNTQEAFPSQHEMLEDFKWYMHRHRESFVQEAFDRRLEYGEKILSEYYNQYIHQWSRIVVVERNIKNVLIKDVPVKGKLDKLEFHNKEVNVVDYKTGDPEKATDKLKPPQDNIPNGGDYWRQAVFYKILVDNHSQREWTVVSTEFDFIEPDKKGKYHKRKLIITPEDIATVTNQITDTWKKIQKREFYTGCGLKECHYCEFVKTNQLQVALHELTEEDITEDEQ